MNDIGMVGLAVMGSSLALNMSGKGFKVAAYDVDSSFVDSFKNGKGSGNENLDFHYDLKSFVDSLEKPRCIFMMIKAGSPVDQMMDKFMPLLDEGDILIDGGNSYFKDTIRRYEKAKEAGIVYMGVGVSGGEEGALKGPALMPGGSKEGYDRVSPILLSIAAKAEDGKPCCDYVGDGGAGHFVKMVHNGIEYGDMQLICESYQLLRDLLELNNVEMADIYKSWNEGELRSYLIEITGNIVDFTYEDGSYVIDTILDKAGQKGTGKWTGITALELGEPLSLITEAVYARCLSFRKEERVDASKFFTDTKTSYDGDKASLIEDIRRALYLSKIFSYAQGFSLLKTASEELGLNLNYGAIATMWRGGCIIRSVFLNKIKEAYDRNPNLNNIILDEYFTKIVKDYIPSLRRVVATAVMNGVPAPAFASALEYFDMYRTENLSANLLQAQRDYFGAHTFEIKGKEGFHHIKWY